MSKPVLKFDPTEHVIIHQGNCLIGTLRRDLSPKYDCRFRFYPDKNLNWLGSKGFIEIQNYIDTHELRQP